MTESGEGNVGINAKRMKRYQENKNTKLKINVEVYIQYTQYKKCFTITIRPCFPWRRASQGSLYTPFL